MLDRSLPGAGVDAGRATDRYPLVSRLLHVDAGVTYAAAGVSIEAGDAAVARMSSSVASTRRREVLGELGGFAGLFSLGSSTYRDPVLVASTDGVGTKLDVARALGRYDTVGIDLVAMLVDDLVCTGAEPLFLLDYVATERVDPSLLADLVEGIARGCRLVGAALLGGETAEHAGVMRPGDLDLAGCAVGIVERSEILGPDRVRDGDVLVGLHSPGLRSNGYSLARRVLLEGDAAYSRRAFEGASTTLGEELLRPSVIYTPAVRALTRSVKDAVRAIAHITGGGIVGNVVRALPEGLRATVELESFTTPDIFFEIQRRGPVSAQEMVRVFNCGLGMVVVIEPTSLDAALEVLNDNGVVASRVGEVVRGERGVDLR